MRWWGWEDSLAVLGDLGEKHAVGVVSLGVGCWGWSWVGSMIWRKGVQFVDLFIKFTELCFINGSVGCKYGEVVFDEVVGFVVEVVELVVGDH